MIKLVVVHGKDPRVRLFSDADLLIGRAEDADLILEDATVAPHHCRIERIPRGYKVVDLDAPGGTLVNDEAVTQKRLKSGDKIVAGQTTIYFQRAPDRVEAAIRARSWDQPVPRGPDPDELRRRLNDVIEKYYTVLGDEGLAEADQTLQAFLTRRGLGYTDTLLEHERRLLRLQSINKALAQEHDEKRLLALILDSAVELTGAERGFLLLTRARGRGLRVEVARNFDQEEIKKPSYKISRSIAEEVARSGEPVVVADAIQDERFLESMSVADLKLRSVICFPLKTRGAPLGVIYLDNRFQPGRFGSREISVLEMFADQAAIALRNARIYRRADPAPEADAAPEADDEAPGAEREARARALLEAGPARAGPRTMRFDYSEIVATSPPMLEVLEMLDRITPTEAPVLITGESGTGKELVARAIHRNGPRRHGPFVSENCAAIPETLLESELFGHTKGAFTGADAAKPGLFQMADDGTLFLDEIGDMPVNLQTKLLRALEKGEVRPVGGNQPVRVNVRIISATNQQVDRMIEAGTFRRDLFYRLNVFEVSLPPLRERWEDIPLLVEHFLAEAAPHGGPAPRLEEDGLLALMLYDWPGNIRELRNEVLRAIALGGGDLLKLEDFSPSVRPPRHALRHIVQQVERRVIQQVLARTGGKKVDTARLLGISRPTLDAKIQTLKIQEG
ncbi:MAG: sigma 54-interacting transcriptional regulator [Planctomycetes bacterium]|nr:sigma 54-interacting transcriptional regulator [Planctomycetota bacterium]